MSEAKAPNCTRCGAPMPVRAASALCPACLLSGALASSGEPVHGSMPMAGPGAPDAAFPRLFGSYRLLGKLGAGGMGTVFEAERQNDGRRVALKVLARRLDSPELRQRFLREGRLAASITHPNSLYVFGAEEIDDTPVITMEVAGGGTLEDEIEKRGPLPVGRAVDAILDVIAGLEAAAAAGVLHRDVKPSNCFVNADGSVKVGDFGLSVSTLSTGDSLATATGVILGTPSYASPEQLRGDELDLRADLYSVGATLFSLLTGKAPFEGQNAVQVVANVVQSPPRRVRELRADVPPGLERVVSRCLAKEPDARYPSYAALRDALLPFGSAAPEPASIATRATAGWIDFLIAFVPAYLVLMGLVGAEELIVRPLVERTLSSLRYWFLLLGCGVLYFSVAEGVFGAGLGKWLKGLRVLRPNGRVPGIGRAAIRILIPLLLVEGVRLPVTFALIRDADWSGLETASFVIVAIACGWIPVLFALRARRETGFATLWDRASGTRVVVRRTGMLRPPVAVEATSPAPPDGAPTMGPFRVERTIFVGEWLEATDPVLRRGVWLVRRTDAIPNAARERVARPGRARWLQSVTKDGETWDAFEAVPGVPFSRLVANGRRLPWSTLRVLLHDLATELWAATGDRSLPAEASLDHVRVTPDGVAVLLDRPWPEVDAPAVPLSIADVAGQQRFLHTVATHVETTSLPLHARPLLRNLEQGRFERLSFLAGTLRGLLERPADVSRGLRAGSIFAVQLWVFLAVFVGYYHDKPLPPDMPWIALGWRLVTAATWVLGSLALVELLSLPLRSTPFQFLFRLAVVDETGERASVPRLLLRWMIVWLPLLVPLACVLLLQEKAGAFGRSTGLAVVIAWLVAAAYAIAQPRRGLQDRLARTWVVRR